MKQSSNVTIEQLNNKPTTDSLHCPYCQSLNFVRRGLRQKKHEKVQLYLCKNCGKTFTPQITKGKHYPLDIVLDAVSIYNLGYNLEQTCRIVNERRIVSLSNCSIAPNNKTMEQLNNITIQPSTLAEWVAEFEPLCRYFKMRPYVTKKYKPKDVVIHATLAHRQLYRYRFHRGKCEILIENEYKHRRFAPLKEFLEMVPGECPHQYFQDGLRASEAPLTFSKTAMIVRAKQNFANRLCEFVLQSVKERKDRHEALQKFMLANDSVTVATEVPVYITRDDLLHMKTQLGFEIYSKISSRELKSQNAKGKSTSQNSKVEDAENPAPLPKLPDVEGEIPAENDPEAVSTTKLPKLITGHIDILQIRNGMVHILDYKPRAEKERPIEQLTLYAMALSRLTGLRLYEFKCAWFDEKDYFEFYPLHVLHKPKRTKRRRKVATIEGVYEVNKSPVRIERTRPYDS